MDVTLTQEKAEELILDYVKGSWDNYISDDTKKVFLALAIPNKLVPVNTLTYDTRIDRNKISISLSALEALQLISQTRNGVSKFCELTEFGWIFAQKYNIKGAEQMDSNTKETIEFGVPIRIIVL